MAKEIRQFPLKKQEVQRIAMPEHSELLTARYIDGVLTLLTLSESSRPEKPVEILVTCSSMGPQKDSEYVATVEDIGGLYKPGTLWHIFRQFDPEEFSMPFSVVETGDGMTRWDYRDGFGPGTPDSEVEVECRAGDVTRGKVRDFDWNDNDSPRDIFKYKFLQIAVPMVQEKPNFQQIPKDHPMAKNPLAKLAPEAWTDHDGGPCPIAAGEIIKVRFKAGHERLDVSNAVNWSQVAAYRAATMRD